MALRHKELEFRILCYAAGATPYNAWMVGKKRKRLLISK